MVKSDAAALKLHLVELFAPLVPGDAVLLAVSAYDWIMHDDAAPAPAPSPAAPVEARVPEPAAEPEGHGAVGGAVEPDERFPAAPLLQVTPERDGRRRIVWSKAMRAELERLCAEGHGAAALAPLFGLTAASMQAAISQRGLTAVWREGRAARAAALSGEPVATPEPAPACDPRAARDVPVGESWAFTEHRTLAEIDPPHADQVPAVPLVERKAGLRQDLARPIPAEIAGPPVPPDAEERRRLIDEHVRVHGVSTRIDFGADQEAADYLRSLGHVVNRPKPGRPGSWGYLVNGRRVDAADLWKLANIERKTRGLAPLVRQREPEAV